MALNPCRECGQEVSTEASVCPHCGISNPTAAAAAPPNQTDQTKKKANSIVGCFVGCLVLIGLVVVMGVCFALLTESARLNKSLGALAKTSFMVPTVTKTVIKPTGVSPYMGRSPLIVTR
jgi:hypothetical protein